MKLPKPSKDRHTKKILDYIAQRVDSYQKAGYVYGDSDSIENDTSTINPFEYLYGLGKYLTNEFPSLFGTTKDEDTNVETFAFNLVCYCFGKDVTEMEDVIENHLLKLTSEDVLELNERIYKAAQEIKLILRPYIEFSFNKDRRKSVVFVPPHSEYQIVAYIAGWFLLSDKARTKNEAYKKAVISHYLYDILIEKWSGGGNRTALEWVRGRDSATSVTKEEWRQALDQWFSDEMKKKEKKRSSQRPQALLFLKYVYSHVLSHHDSQAADNFELDHLVPVKRLQDLIAKRNLDGLSINCVANMALIPAIPNRMKQDNTIYEVYPTDDTELLEIEKYTITIRKDLQFTKKKLSKDEYENFLKIRFSKLSSLFISQILK